jgi:Mg2+/citrate symporter
VVSAPPSIEENLGIDFAANTTQRTLFVRRSHPIEGHELSLGKENSRRLQVRWVIANLASSAIGFGVFAVLAHGLANPHDEEHPSLAQFAAHALGLLPAGAIIALGQRLALRRHQKLASWFVPVTSLAMTAAFLVGAYELRPPFDFLFGYAAVGVAVELALKPANRSNLRRAVQSTAVTSLLFTAGSFVGMLALSLIAKALGAPLGKPGEDVVHHLITMAFGGLFIGAAVGLLTAPRIARRIIPLGSAEERAV